MLLHLGFYVRDFNELDPTSLLSAGSAVLLLSLLEVQAVCRTEQEIIIISLTVLNWLSAVLEFYLLTDNNYH